MSTASDIRLGVELELACEHADSSLYHQLRSGAYDEMSVMPLPSSIGEWRAEHSTARRRAHRAAERGYTTRDLVTVGGDDWDAINRSATHRQGRPMSAGYRTRTAVGQLEPPRCQRHTTRATGVCDRHGTLVAYLVMLRAGQLALVSQILGHADHLRNEIMYLLFEHALQREISADPEGVVVYNRHDSGTDGLRFFKARLGFEAQEVRWLP